MTPSESAYARSEMELAARVLADARHLIDMGSLESGASRLYYAAFHAARAALAVRGQHAKTHSGQISLYTDAFGPAPILGRLLKLRGAADYGREPFQTDEQALLEAFEATASFLEGCRQVIDEALARGPDEPDPEPDV